MNLIDEFQVGFADLEFFLFNADMFLSKPKNFSFKNTIISHGWSELTPFEIDQENWRLSNVFENGAFEKPIAATISATPKKLKIEFADSRIGKAKKEKVKKAVKHILRLDEDFSEFYRLTNKHKEFRWIAKNSVSRLMRSPTVFEDLVKTICTTNCSWALTKNMVTNLVETLGEEASNGKKAFPKPEALAKKNEKFYREEIRSGYRSPYFVELGEAVASGKVNPEEWLETDLPTVELKNEMKKIKGVGDYAAENLLKLVGRYDGLALDSFLRSEFYKKHNKEKPCSDKKIEKFYKKFGEWRGLAIWFDMSKRWFG